MPLPFTELSTKKKGYDLQVQRTEFINNCQFHHSFSIIPITGKCDVL